MKQGTVALIGRPNVGKSTLVNTIVGHKVSITSPKPQTTRFPIQALYIEERGEIVFVDLPGIFKKAIDPLSKKINRQTLTELEKDFDVFLYVVDPTRKREFEEGKVLGIVRNITKPKILVINKIDEEQKYLPQYEFLKDEFDSVVSISALKNKHVKTLIDMLFERLPEQKKGTKKTIELADNTYGTDSKTFIAELIREKVYLQTRKNLPYTTTVVVEEIEERENGILYIKAQIVTTDLVYKKMLIGMGAWKIKEIGSMTRREIEMATNKHVFLDLEVVVDKHWIEALS